MIRFLLRAIRLLLLAMWLPTAAVASQVTFGQAMQAITGLEWALVFMFSTLAGATALLMKFSAHVNAVSPGQPVPPMRNPWVLSFSHMLASWLAGLVGFFIATNGGMNGLYVALFVPMCAFGGAKTHEMFWKQKVGPMADDPKPTP